MTLIVCIEYPLDSADDLGAAVAPQGSWPVTPSCPGAMMGVALKGQN